MPMVFVVVSRADKVIQQTPAAEDLHATVIDHRGNRHDRKDDEKRGVMKGYQHDDQRKEGELQKRLKRMKGK